MQTKDDIIQGRHQERQLRGACRRWLVVAVAAVIREQEWVSILTSYFQYNVIFKSHTSFITHK